MKTCYTSFGGQRVILPVIHVVDERQAVRNAVMARSEGADGVFLISHGPVSGLNLIQRVYPAVRSVVDRFWVGVNCLDMDNCEALIAAQRAAADALWVDNCGADAEDPTEGEALARTLADLHARYASGHVPAVFGGTAFKYQPSSRTPADAARRAAAYVNVVTTSGAATGSEPDVAKIKAMRKAIGPTGLLAIASGISSENIGDYVAETNAFLVASSISERFDRLDPVKVRQLVRMRDRVWKH